MHPILRSVLVALVVFAAAPTPALAELLSRPRRMLEIDADLESLRREFAALPQPLG